MGSAGNHWGEWSPPRYESQVIYLLLSAMAQGPERGGYLEITKLRSTSVDGNLLILLVICDD